MSKLYFIKKIGDRVFWTNRKWRTGWETRPRFYHSKSAAVQSMYTLFADQATSRRVPVMGGHEWERVPRKDTLEQMLKRHECGIFVIDLDASIEKAERIA